jgi:F-type H+-transporting ATPase subunit a
MVLFTFIVTSNLLGLLPGSFAPTSHIAATAVLAIMVFLTVTLVGLYKKGFGFLAMFWVSSAPLALRPILALIELISYFVRPVSHSIRLGGNIMAGHAVIKVFASFAGVMGLASFVPIVAIAAIYGLELLVAIVQAYVFTILTCVYLRDAVGEAQVGGTGAGGFLGGGAVTGVMDGDAVTIRGQAKSDATAKTTRRNTY